MKKSVFFLTLLAVLALGFGVIAAQDDPLAGIDPSGQTVVYWHEWDGAQLEGITEVIELFNSTNAYGITVQSVPQGNTGNLQEQMSAGITSGLLPNLVGGVFAAQAQSYYLDGVLVPLDAYFESPTWGFSEEELADLNMGLLNVNRIPGEPFNDQLLMWPIGLSANVLSVNLDMVVDELGFDGPPETLEQFREIACAANELTSATGGDVQGFPLRTSSSDLYSFVVSQGGFMYADGQYNFTNEKFIETLQFFQDLYNDGCAYIPDGPFVNTADFAFGLNPFAVGSSVGVPFISRDIESSGSGIQNWVNTTTPWAEGERTLQVFLRSIGLITSTPENQLATWLFIKHLASAEAQVIWTEAAQYIPYVNSTLDNLSAEFLAANPQFDSVRQVLLDPEINIWSQPPLLAGVQVNRVVDELIVNITTGQQDVATAAAEAEARANQILAESLEDLGQ